MAIDFIGINRTAVNASMLLAYVSQLRQALNTGEQMLAIMSHLHNGVDFTNIESRFGVPSGKGQAIFDFINGSVGSFKGTFQTADAKNITETVG